jgi:ectoine hydroxylase-related dioxygenase (phytanoyl-CoA dioxygenase family)
MVALKDYRADAKVDDVAETLARDGGVIVHDMLPPGVADQIVADLSTTYATTSPGAKDMRERRRKFHGNNTVRFCGLADKSDAFVEHALLNPMLLSLSDHFLLPHSADYWLNTGQVMAVGPGEPAQVLHVDQNNWPEALHPDKELTISCMFALNDFTVENGATVVAPGSNLVERGVTHGGDFAAEDLTQAVMPKGSGMIYSGKTIHGAGHNQSDDWRYGMHVSFVVGWLRPEEASPLVVSKERAAQLSTRARTLLGWSSYQSIGGGRTWLVDFEDAERMFSDSAT